MSMTPDELEEFTFAHLPDAFIRRALMGVFRAHADSWRYCRDNFTPGEGKNLLPFHRRARVEANLLAAAELHSDLTARSIASNDAWWHHVEIQGGPIILTSASTTAPCGDVRWSQYRGSLAQSGQLRLFDEHPPENAPLYVLLLHTKFIAASPQEHRDFGHLPGAAYISWPNGDLKHHLHAVNLFDRYPDVVEANLPVEWDPDVRLRYVERSRRQAS
ncbi:MAG: hypothetical protein CL424_12905 [Acidimicrobiaceae bacterium]|nr:hypothetical protein [Acidimicrobiaceae bacterium]